MSKIEFKIGDVVQLKSGGVKMTVYAVDDEERTLFVACYNEVTGLIATHKSIPVSLFKRAVV